MAKKGVERLLVTGVFSLLVIVLCFTGLGFISVPPGSITVLQTPVVIAAMLEGPSAGCFVGLLFGISSIIQAAMGGVSPVDMTFLHYPYIAVIPRVFIGPAAWLVYVLVSGRLSRHAGIKSGFRPGWFRETLGVITGALTGSLVNTVLVLAGFVIIFPEILNGEIAMAVLSQNGPVEGAVSVTASLAVILPWRALEKAKT